MRMNRRNRLLAFTLVELLVVIAIIGMLVALLLPAVQSARQAGRRAQCQNKLRQLGIALTGYDSAHSMFPSGVTASSDDLGDGDHSGFSLLLPYLEQQALFDQMDFRRGWKENANVMGVVIEELQCPSSPSSLGMPGGFAGAVTDYAFSKGPEAYLCRRPLPAFHGMFDVNSKIQRAHIRDGLSNTFAIGEAASSASLNAFAT